MRALVVGGSGSGKSAFAERLACDLSPTRTYLATMSDDGPEASERIQRHRSQREGLGFTTVECPHGSLDEALRCCDAKGVALLDDLGNLLSNALFSHDGSMGEPKKVLGRLGDEVEGLARSFEHIVVVGNEVGSEGPSPFEATGVWVKLMGSLCCGIAANFDVVVEVVSGIPILVKGELP